MKKYDLSILIPARNEEFLARTVENILENKRGNTQIIVALDGQWANPPLKSHDDLVILYLNESVGQRAATNIACRVSHAKYIMKIDAHCAVDEGFDVKMMDLMEDDITAVPVMYNLHAFDWVCQDCNERQYQGPSHQYKKCPKCGKDREREIIWKPRWNKKSTAYRFDTTLHFQYHGDYKKVQETQGALGETLSLQGSCFMLTREKYWELNICDENHGGWGQQGVEVALKTWLSGGRVVTNMTTWYAHMFRTQGGDFGFPYRLTGSDVDKAREYSRSMWFNNTFDKQIYPLSWLLEKFQPVPDWHSPEGAHMLEQVKKAGEEFSARAVEKPRESEPVEVVQKSSLTKGIIFYTDNQLSLRIARRVQGNLKKMGLPIVSASIKPMSFGSKNVYFPMHRGYLTMFRQILGALEASTADVVFFCEHDVIYHKSHFDFTPTDPSTFYYNINVVKADVTNNVAVKVDVCEQVSGICVYRETAVKHYRERVAYIEKNGFDRNMGFEPGTHGRVQWVHPVTSARWQSEFPNVDIRHNNNLTKTRTSPGQFRNKDNAKGWTEMAIENIPGWKLRASDFV